MISVTYDDLCMVFNLKSRLELNGRAVRVCLPDGKIADDRVPVELMIGMRKIAVKATNLFKLEGMQSLSSPVVTALMPEEDKNDCKLFFLAMEGSTRVAPGVTLMPTKPTPAQGPPLDPDAPLTEDEKATALCLGPWGDLSGDKIGWGDFTRSVKARRGGENYPSDWYPQIILGDLFKGNGQSHRDGFIDVYA